MAGKKTVQTPSAKLVFIKGAGEFEGILVIIAIGTLKISS